MAVESVGGDYGVEFGVQSLLNLRRQLGKLFLCIAVYKGTEGVWAYDVGNSGILDGRNVNVLD